MFLTHAQYDWFFPIFVISRSTKILIESNFWLGMYLSYILEDSVRSVNDSQNIYSDKNFKCCKTQVQTIKAYVSWNENLNFLKKCIISYNSNAKVKAKASRSKSLAKDVKSTAAPKCFSLHVEQ